jgi:opacity protein-like surface antigen
VKRVAFAVLLSSCVLAAPRAAKAAGEDEWQLSARLGGANKNGSPTASWGLAGALDLEYGLNDAWSLRVSAGTLSHPVPAVKDVSPAGSLRATSGVAGATYTFDVLRLVPYVEGGVGLVYWSGTGIQDHAALALELGIGADYLLTPHWAIGGSAQYLFAPAELLSNVMQFGEAPLAFSVTARFSRIF